MPVDQKPIVVPFLGGLDLVSPKLVAPSGTMLSCENYEQVDFAGYKRIDGYERYSGHASTAITELYVIRTSASIAAYTVGDILMGEKSDPYSAVRLDSENLLGPFGVLVKKTTSGAYNAMYFAKLNDTYLPRDGDTCYRLDLTSGAEANGVTVVDVDTILNDLQSDEDAAYTEILAAQEVLRGFVEEMPGQPIGLHWFRDRLYGVCGMRRLFIVPTTDGTTPSTGNKVGPVLPSVGATLTGAGGATGIIARITDLGLAPATADADFTDLEVVEVVVHDLMTGDWDDEHIASGLTWTGCTGLVHTVSADSLLAQLWSCKSIPQMYDEDTAPLSLGWKPIHPGWLVPFNNGNIAAGYFDKVERNSDNATPSTYYFSDGATTFTCQVSSYFVTSGTLTGGTAVGYLQIRNLARTAGTGDIITTAYDMYSDVGLLTKVADVTASMSINALEGLKTISTSGTRYEFISSNFYGDADGDALYGVNGVGRAFYYDTDLFAKIFTQGTAANDNPRHIENFVGHLALGFYQGSLQLSVAGEPWNYNGTDGASEIAMGSPVLGLSTVSGDTLAVFCDDNIEAVYGQVVDEFTKKTLVPNAGFIEYSLITMGTAIYTTNWGITSLDQSDKYGDFVGSRLSKAINPWLLPKLVDKDSGRYGSAGVLAAMPVRTKNQYRLFLKDGSIVTMTMSEEGPGFTFQKWARTEDTFAYIRPVCISSQMDNFGKERIHFATWELETVVPIIRETEDEEIRVTEWSDERITEEEVLQGQNGSNFVFEADSGWSFDGEPISAFFSTNYIFDQNVSNFQTLSQVRLHGLALGKSSIEVYAAGIENSYESEYHNARQDISLDRSLRHNVYQEFVPATNIASVASRGLATKLLIATTNTTPEPAHVAQVLIAYVRDGGKSDS